MTTRGLPARVLFGLGLSGCAILALASVLVLHGGTLAGVGVVAALTGGLTYLCRDERGAQAAAVACKAAAGAVAIIMIVTGAGVTGGGVLVALVTGSAFAVGGAMWLRRVMQERSSTRHGRAAAAPGEGARAEASPSLAGLLDGSPPPVSLMPTIGLGREWLRTSAELQSRLEPAARQKFVWRRQNVLDELERRDPAGFARWLVAAPYCDNDPADFVRGGRIRGGDTT